jgi:hypothetical protein
MRELNPNLFENLSRPQWVEPTSSSKAVAPVDPNADRQLLEMARQMKSLEKLVLDQKAVFDETTKAQNAKIDRLTQHIRALENAHAGSLKEIQERLATIMTRLSERRAVDAKMEDMVDRHNEIVQGFELKLKALHKVLADREAQILKTMGLLEEARSDIARLKRL